jgi:hypothetical protein
LKNFDDELETLFGLFPEEMIKFILLKTVNKKEKYSQKNEKSKRDKRRSNLTISVETFKSYLIVHLCMWLFPYPELQLYWESDNPFYPKSNIIPSLISYEIFKDINDAIEFDVKSNKDMMEDLIEMWNTIQSECYLPDHSVVIDECLKKNKSKKNPYGVAIHSKPAKKGHKFFNLTDSKYFTYKIMLYLGKGSTGNVSEIVENFIDSLPKEIKIGDNIQKLDWSLTADSGFSSTSIAKMIDEKKIGMILAAKPSKDFGKNC